MSLSAFNEDPTKLHEAYDGSFLTTVRPEYSTGEVLLGSAYRRLLLNKHDREVDLEDITRLPGHLATIPLESEAMWKGLFLERSGLASPPPAGQQKHGLRQLMPLVPEIGRYACVLGKKRDRWYPGSLLMQVIGAGVGRSNGQGLVLRLQEALDINDGDDLFAIFLNGHLRDNPLPDQSPIDSRQLSLDVDSRAYQEKICGRIWSPAERFCVDLDAILALKRVLTRRQWIVLLGALIRIGLTMHFLWVCRLNDKFWQMILGVIDGNPAPSSEEIESTLWQCHNRQRPILEIGRDGATQIRQCISNYVQAQFGINLVLFMLEEAGVGWKTAIGQTDENGQETTLTVGIHAFLSHVSQSRLKIDKTDPCSLLEQKCSQLIDEQHELVECKRGSSKNLFEFARYSLGQIQPAIDDEKAYDQSYLLIRKNKSNRSPWPVRIGPAMLIALVHACCTAQEGVPTSVEDFRDHLEEYGLWVGVGELSRGQIGTDLEKLGLVIDSPDAVGGRLLVAPF